MAKTINDIQTISDLKNTSWIFNETLNFTDKDSGIEIKFFKNNNIKTNCLYYEYGDNSHASVMAYGIVFTRSEGMDLISYNETDDLYFRHYIMTFNKYDEDFTGLPRKLTFNDFETYTINGSESDFITDLKNNATLIVEESIIVRINGKVLNTVNGKKVRAIHYGDKTWEL